MRNQKPLPAGDPYSGLATIYDFLMQEVDYEGWTDYVEEIMHRHHISAKKILDLACGTGSSSYPFAHKGYLVTGIDYSWEMVKKAREKVKPGITNLFFYQADIRTIPGHKDFQLAVHYQDGLNYLLTDHDLKKAFQSVYRILTDQGSFIFDLSFPGYFHGKGEDDKPEKCRVQEEYFTLLWETSYSMEKMIRETWLTIKTPGDNSEEPWQVFQEYHREKEHDREKVLQLLKESGFELQAMYPTFKFTSPLEKEPRITFFARKKQY